MWSAISRTVKLRRMPVRSLRRGFELAMSNSLRFIRDAKILVAGRSYSHARGVAIMALEEFGKGVLYYRRLVGLNPVTPIEMTLLKGAKPINKRGPEFDHQLKQHLGIVSLVNLYLNLQLSESEIRDKKITQVLRRYFDATTRYLTEFATERQRQRCFYVGYENGRWHDPLSIGFEERYDIIPALEYAISLYRELQCVPLRELRKLSARGISAIAQRYKDLYEAGLIEDQFFKVVMTQLNQVSQEDLCIGYVY